MDPPNVSDKSALDWERNQKGPEFYTIGPNWLRKSDTGLWEMYVEGEAFERGVSMGKLQRELNLKQENSFINRLKVMVPSETYIRLLKYGIAWFNRNLPDYVEEEFNLEIYGFTEAYANEPDSFAFVGPKYQRKLNYHAAHDIGHALQNMDMVQCTSFGVWGDGSADSGLIIGRNFDFYVGDEFAKNKIIAFYKPQKGHKFMMVTWSGMTGVTSGMNTAGLTITLNSAKSPIPTASKTPVSLLAREIIQFAGNIEEAFNIALKRETFVTETFLIGSAADGRAALIEKTPEKTALFDPNNGRLICTNHLQAKAFFRRYPEYEAYSGKCFNVPLEPNR